MPSNRRNYYRLLHVQPDAPAEVIKASYRALMSLHHPDKGGTHTNAALVNEAYAVLADVVSRAKYDAQRSARSSRTGSDTHRGSASTATPPPRAPAHGACPLCLLVARLPIRHDSRCERCRSPLSPVARPGSAEGVTERRSMPRVTKSDWAVLHMDWQSDTLDVRMRDLSLDGICVYSGLELPVHRTVRVVGAAFDVVATVVKCRAMGRVYSLHGRLITAMFTTPTGGFMSRSA